MHESSIQTRRRFLQDTATLAAGVSLAWPLVSTAAARQVAANEKLAIGIIGAGGRGWDNLQGVKSERIVALADVDDRQAKNAFKQFPDAVRYRDFREMLDKEKTLDAVVVSTPDHVHAAAAIAAMNRGLHVYCEKPLAHTIYEARRMSEVAQKTGVVTQMGIQGHAMEGTPPRGRGGPQRRHRRRERATCMDRSTGRLVAAGGRAAEGIAPGSRDARLGLVVGPGAGATLQRSVRAVQVARSVGLRHGRDWRHGRARSRYRVLVLELGVPTSADVVAACLKTDDCPPLASVLDIRYPARGSAPPVKLLFYDGKLLPPPELFQGEEISDNGSLMIGTKGTLYTRTWHGGENDQDMFLLLPRKEFVDYKPPAPTLPRAEEHHSEWIKACKGGPPTQANFQYAARLTEGLLVGQLAIRVGKKIEWDEKQMQATGCPEANAFIHPQFRSGWEV